MDFGQNSNSLPRIRIGFSVVGEFSPSPARGRAGTYAQDRELAYERAGRRYDQREPGGTTRSESQGAKRYAEQADYSRSKSRGAQDRYGGYSGSHNQGTLE